MSLQAPRLQLALVSSGMFLIKEPAPIINLEAAPEHEHKVHTLNLESSMLAPGWHKLCFRWVQLTIPATGVPVYKYHTPGR